MHISRATSHNIIKIIWQ